MAGCSGSTKVTKVCRRCNRELPRTREFYNYHWSSNRERYQIETYCRECKKGYCANYGQERRSKGLGTHGRVGEIKNSLAAITRYENEKLTDDGLRKCIQCQEVKPRDKEHFRWDAAGYNFFGKCHECDGDHKFRTAYRSRVADALKNNKRDGKVEELLGCSVPEGRKHVEATWKLGMSWANHGMHGWHIDHIRPCASFDLSLRGDQLACFHHKNLQALWAKENLEKGAKWSG